MADSVLDPHGHLICVGLRRTGHHLRLLHRVAADREVGAERTRNRPRHATHVGSAANARSLRSAA
eukprot:scaffold96607_cov66-Phaeocystis_antarctica.AAC.3